MPDPLAELLEQLDLTALDDDLYLGDPGTGEGRLFGGHVAAQSLLAAGRTVSGVVVIRSMRTSCGPAGTMFPSVSWWTASAMGARSPHAMSSPTRVAKRFSTSR